MVHADNMTIYFSSGRLARTATTETRDTGMDQRTLPPTDDALKDADASAPSPPATSQAAEESPPPKERPQSSRFDPPTPLARGIILCGVFLVTLLACLYCFDSLDLNRSESLIMQWHNRSLSVN
jgi:hypothetical protein